MPVEIRYLLLTLVTMALSLLFTRAMRRMFSRFRSREQKAGKELIYRHFPRHKKPLGGGMAIFAALTVGVVVARVAELRIPADVWGGVFTWLLCGLAFGAIGFIDDWRKVNAARGLHEWAKLLLQTLFALIFTLVVVSMRNPSLHDPTAVFFPFIGWVTLGYLFLPFGVLVIVGASTAVNLTDGLDGLAGFSLAITFAGYLLLGTLLQHPGIPAVIPLFALAALAGFLFYNRPTARIIMGDTGALGLGAALGVLALLSQTEWLLLLLAAPFVIDTVSVMIQMSVIKFFRRPVRLLRHQTTEVFRPFLCTPLHHHFQWLTWGPWPILALFSGVGVTSVLLAVMAYPAAQNSLGAGWFWLFGIVLQAGFLAFAALQKVVRANYFLGLEPVEGSTERMLSLYKGLPIEVFGARWYTLEQVTGISESMVNNIAAEGILWRNISEIEARATLGKIHAEYRMFEDAAQEWEEIPLRNLLLRENLVVQLGKIYFGRDELLRAIKLWEQLPPSRLANVPGLSETIQSGKVRIGHLASRLYRQARDHAAALQSLSGRSVSPAELSALTAELEGALRYTQDLRDLLAYEQQKAERTGEFADMGSGTDLYRRMDAMLTARREELHQALRWAQEQTEPGEAGGREHTPLQQLSEALSMTPAEISRALAVSAPLPVREFVRIEKPSRNTLYRIALEGRDAHLPERLVAKCFEDAQVTFFSACYRREYGVLQLLQEVDAPVPRLYGGYLGARMGVLFLDDLGAQDLTSALLAVPEDDRVGRVDLLRRALGALVALRVHALPIMDRLEREIGKIVKEVLTPEYYLNTTVIALNRILALERRKLSAAERGRLKVALSPLVAALMEEPKTFIHFEYTPGNLQFSEGRIIAVDFEQSTMGPAAFDIASLLYAPEARLADDEVADLLRFYHDLLPSAAAPLMTVRPEALEAAAIMKLIFYAGSAANFFRRFEETHRLDSMEWYLRTADRFLMRNPDLRDLGETLRQCWQMRARVEV